MNRWPFDGFPEDLSTWESCKEKWNEAQEELGRQDAEIIFLKNDVELLKETLKTLQKDLPWGQGDVVTKEELIELTLNKLNAR